jgi:hypothetical protein
MALSAPRMVPFVSMLILLPYRPDLGARMTTRRLGHQFGGRVRAVAGQPEHGADAVAVPAEPRRDYVVAH